MRLIAFMLISVFCSSLFARAAEIKYAQNFLIEEHGTHTLLTVRNPYREATKQYLYALVPKEQDLPRELPAGAAVIRTPVSNVVLMETVYVGYLETLQEIEAIRGAASTQFMTNPTVRNRVQAGIISKIQSGQKVDLERLLLLQPDLILTTSLGSGGIDVSSQIKRAGLPVVLTADYMETHPLGRAEWIKFIAAFFEIESEATLIFDQVESEYRNLLKLTEEAEKQPSVFCGATYAGVWHVPGGQSFFAQFLTDAGANYLWRDDDSQGGLPLDVERVFLKAAHADFWINPSHYRSMEQLLATDNRFVHFGAVEHGNVYNQTRKIDGDGGNPIWERGIVHPEEVLADLIKIFHPEQLPEHELIYYERLK